MSETRLCETCGAFGDLPHEPVEGDCILPHRYDRKTHPPRARIGWLCHGCLQRHLDQLGQIVDWYAMLGEVLLAGSIPDDTAPHQHVKKQPASPSPLRLVAWAMLIDTDRLHVNGQRAEDGTWQPYDYTRTDLPDVPAVLAAWANTARGTYDTPFTVTGAVHILTAHAETIAAQPWVDEYDAELHWLHRTLKTASGTVDQQPLGRCLTVTEGRDCGGRVWPTSDKPRCDRCKRPYGTLDLVRLKRMEEAS